MNKEQQIEEIAGTICNTCKERFEISEKCKNVIGPCLAAYAHAEALYNAGYSKIDENCAMITKAELKQYKVQAVKEFAEMLKAMCSDYLYDTNFDGKNDFDIHIGELSRMIDELLKEYEK